MGLLSINNGHQGRDTYRRSSKCFLTVAWLESEQISADSSIPDWLPRLAFYYRPAWNFSGHQLAGWSVVPGGFMVLREIHFGIGTMQMDCSGVISLSRSQLRGKIPQESLLACLIDPRFPPE